jgi:hypothetical protein
MQNTLLHRLQDFNQQRPQLPGEHWLTLGAGLLLLGRSRDSALGSLLSKAAGAALVWRALQGRNGLLALARGELARSEMERGELGPASLRPEGAMDWHDTQPEVEPARGEGYVDVDWPDQPRVRADSDDMERSDARVGAGGLPGAH